MYVSNYIRASRTSHISSHDIYLHNTHTNTYTYLFQALKMAIAARCTVIIALNKIDKVPKGQERLSARSRVLAQIVQIGLIPEEYGGIGSDLMLDCITSHLKFIS